MTRRPMLFVLALSLFAIARPAAAVTPVEKPKDVDPSAATLAVAVSDWVSLLEKDDAKTAAIRWAANPEAAKLMTEHWPLLKERHGKFDYRTWINGKDGIAGAAAVGDARIFKVGGHAFGHLHVDWEKTAAGWRVVNVYQCR
ncbi:MAG TPA: hypothetical protein VF796_23995 [Humisphaera sp.]